MRIFLTNLGKYNEGELCGEWLKLPCSKEKLAATLVSIGIGKYYEEYFITDYDCDIGLEIGEYTNLNALNEVAERISDLTIQTRRCYAPLWKPNTRTYTKYTSFLII